MLGLLSCCALRTVHPAAFASSESLSLHLSYRRKSSSVKKLGYVCSSFTDQVRPRPRPFQTLLSPGTLTTRPTTLAPKEPKPPPMLRLRVFHWSASWGTSAAGTRRARATVPPTLTKPSRLIAFSANSEKSFCS